MNYLAEREQYRTQELSRDEFRRFIDYMNQHEFHVGYVVEKLDETFKVRLDDSPLVNWFDILEAIVIDDQVYYGIALTKQYLPLTHGIRHQVGQVAGLVPLTGFTFGGQMELYFKSEKLNQDVQWIWTDMEKAYWQTWIPKKSNLKILSKLSKDEMQIAKDELWDNLQDSIQFTRDQINFKKRQKRLAKKS